MVIPPVLTMATPVQGKAKLQVHKWEKILVPWSEKRWRRERCSGCRLEYWRAWLTQVRGKEPWETMKEMAA